MKNPIIEPFFIAFGGLKIFFEIRLLLVVPDYFLFCCDFFKRVPLERFYKQFFKTLRDKM